MVILDQSKPISLILKIKKLKIEKSENYKLHVYFIKMEVRQVYNPF